jgi:hypothetical protein
VAGEEHGDLIVGAVPDVVDNLVGEFVHERPGPLRVAPGGRAAGAGAGRARGRRGDVTAEGSCTR